MVKIRLQRVGVKNQPKYRIVACESQVKRGGKTLEIIGHYNPTIEPSDIDVKKDRYEHWVKVGAQSTKAVSDLVKRYEKISRVSD